MKKVLLNIAETADTLRVSTATLAAWRAKGYGPRHTKVGARVFYDPDVIADWLVDQRVGTRVETIASAGK